MKTLTLSLVFIMLTLIFGCGRKNAILEHDIFKAPVDLTQKNDLCFLEGRNLSNIKVYASFKDSIELKDLIKTDHLIILLYSQIACMDCINKVYAIINEVDESHKLNIIVLTDFQESRVLYTIMKQHNLEFPYYSTLHNNIGFNINEFPGPYLLVLEKSLHVKNALSTSLATKSELTNFLLNN